MHKDLQLAIFDFANTVTVQNAKFTQNQDITAHIPIGISQSLTRLNEWLIDRAIPSSRDGSTLALKKLNIPSTKSLLLNTLALTLTDCYWLKPITSQLTWSMLNLYTNNFTDVFGELTFNINYNLNMQRKTLFTGASTQGELKKKWCIDNNNIRFLIKGNHGNNYQQSLNEILATKLHSLQKTTPFVPYYLTPVTLTNQQSALGCYCYSFCNENTEFISAWDLLNAYKPANNVSKYQHFVDVCKSICKFSQEYIDNFMSYLIMSDFLLTNTDRHMNNIGVLRNPDTLEYIGFAPIYDSGNSMFFRESLPYTKNILKINSCSFTKQEVQGLKNVAYRNILNLKQIPTQSDFQEIYSQDIPERQYRIPHLYDLFMRKCDLLDKFQNGTDIWHFNFIQSYK